MPIERITIIQWMSQNKDFLVCPICKSGISYESIIPIYGPSEESSSSNKPKGKRLRPFLNKREDGKIIMGYGFFPSNAVLSLVRALLVVGQDQQHRGRQQGELI